MTIRFEPDVAAKLRAWAEGSNPPMSLNAAVQYLAMLGYEVSQPDRTVELAAFSKAVELIEKVGKLLDS